MQIQTQTQPASRERRSDAQDRLKTLLASRTQTLTLFSQLVGIRPFSADPALQGLLQEFCEALVDYTASAHFQLYRFIDDGTERRARVKTVAAQVYPRIVDSTQLILDFNEKYDCEDCTTADYSQLDQDLSQLGELLADRISHEDQVIAALSIAPRP
ncbi:MAG: Rsd/AlgQ family anti-sigma factor [Gammaproteobacteria bacterium]|nr:Rsd/AlgQ family anti-sigma factor [Gammaproteobacteria bacterium]